MSNDADVQAKVDMLAKVFKGRLHVRYEKMNEAFAQCEAGTGGDAPWHELHRLLHSLSGAAGTFGFDALGEHARRIELRVKDMLAQGQFHTHDAQVIGQELQALQARP